ncbi:Dicer-like protein 1 [Coemansia aciculifera]|nr:Dicer-like protein 1 [Coemansia aciculifera]
MLSWPAAAQASLGEQGSDDGNEASFADSSLNDTAPLLPSNMQPREYQLSLFKRALQDNAIVLLETGTGKTLVAVMLIQWFAQRAITNPAAPVNTSDQGSLPPRRPRRKIRVFLNNTVALAHQQARVIAENSKQKVKELVGSMSIDEWDEARWAAEWESSSVLVMIHQVLLNALRAGLARISDIDLLVFDECHHARGHHPYALIMREFYDHCPAHDRPHIFGMTASPLNSCQSASASVMHLRAMLDSSICTVNLTASHDAPPTQPKSICYEYALPPEYADTALTLALTAQCGSSDVIRQGLKIAPVILALLGPFGVDQMWHHYIHQWHRKMRLRPAPLKPAATRKPQMQLCDQPQLTVMAPAAAPASVASASETSSEDVGDSSSADPAAINTLSVDISAEIAEELQPQVPDPNSSPAADTAESLDDVVYLWRALAIDHNFGGSALTRYSGRLGGALPAPHSHDSMDVGTPVEAASEQHPLPQLHNLVASPESWDSIRELLSPQVNRLLGILYQWQSCPQDLRGIVFTSRRLTAVLLVYIISTISEFSFIRADVLLGASQKPGGSMDRPIRSGSVRTANQLTLADFASGRLNLIFATQVAEEGVDIQPCNVVVRFDMPNTATSLIQSRGRARMQNSQFIVMVPEMSDSERSMAASDGAAAGIVAALPGEDIDSACPGDAMQDVKRQPSIPEHTASFTDYLKLVSLEKCMREWCQAESKASDSQVADGVLVASDLHTEYGRLLRKLHASLVLDDSPSSSDVDEPWIESRDATGRIYMVKSTQARITYLSAVPIVHRYVQLLPQDSFCLLAPVFEFESAVHYQEQAVHYQEQTAPGETTAPTKKKKKPKPILVTLYRCKVTLPANAALRQVAGPLMPNKRLAKQVTAFRAAKKLHQLGAIDDNLVPVSEPSADELDADKGSDADVLDLQAEAGSQKRVRGARSSVNSYETIVPEQFIPPPCTPVSTRNGDMSDSDSCEGNEYQPFPWHLYLVSLKHPDSPNCARIILATARPLPIDTKVPLYTEQFASGLTELDSAATFIEPLYVGSQVLSGEQVDLLAAFSSKLLVRVLRSAQSWETAKIGVLLAPPLLDGSGIDFDLAENLYSDRSRILENSNGCYTQWVGKMVMDGLDYGKLKIVERLCEDVDIYSNLSAYHYARSVSEKAEAQPKAQPGPLAGVAEQQPSTDIVSVVASDEPPHKLPSNRTGTKRAKDGVSARFSIQTMADWAVLKRVSRMLSNAADGHAAPLFRLNPVSLTYNYLVASTVHIQTPPAADVEAQNCAALVSDSGKLAYPDVVYSSPFFCAAEPIDLPTLNNLSLLPAFFVRLGQVLTASAVKAQLGLCARVETVRQAITASCASLDTNYERLEILGDSVLKLVSSTMLFVAHPDDHEGLLTQRRGRIVSNANLFTLARKLGLAEYLISHAFNKREQIMPGHGWQRTPSIPSKWVCTVPQGPTADGADSSQQLTTSSSSATVSSIGGDTSSSATVSNTGGNESTPVASQLPQQGQTGEAKEAPKKEVPVCKKVNTTRMLSDKTVADVIEAILGASVIDGGFAGALAAARSMGVVGDMWSSWSEFGRVWRETIATRKDGVQLLNTICLDVAVAATAAAEVAGGIGEAQERAMEAELDRADVLYSRSMLGNERLLGFGADQPYVDMLSASRAEEIEGILGYRFKNRALLAEAVTHCSSTDLHANSYQRLEFLGDAVLDYFITRRYYDYQPELRPHRITLVKHVACSNNLFALIVVCNGLHRFLRHSSVVLAVSVRDYEFRLAQSRKTWVQSQSKEEGQSESSASDLGLTDGSSATDKSSSDNSSSSSWSQCSASAWSDEESQAAGKRRKVCLSKNDEESDLYWGLPQDCWDIVPAPKVLGDVFESLLGAIYVDSDMDMAAAEGFYQRMLSPFLDRFVDSGRLSLHSVIHTLLICQGWGCDLISWEGSANPDQLDYMGKYICRVKAHGCTLAEAKGESPRHAKLSAGKALLDNIDAIAPNALHGDLDALNCLLANKDAVAAESKLDRLLKPVCTCKESRRAEAEAAVAKAAAAAKAEAVMAVDPI